MANGIEKYCPKCNNKFICKVDDIENCICSAIKLTSKAAENISQTYTDCLCIDCLLQINDADYWKKDGTD